MTPLPARLLVVILGGWIVVAWTDAGVGGLFAVVAVAMTVFGLGAAFAVARIAPRKTLGRSAARG